MRFKEIASRLTGFSTPLFGVSWKPPRPEVQRAKRLVTHFEDRRVLFSPSELEQPDHCVASIIEIRRLLTAELEELDPKSELGASLRAMRSACRKFLDSVQAEDERIIQFATHRGHFASWQFMSALGELRGVFGIHLAKIAASYGLDVEDQLASIFPGEEGERVG